MTSSSSTSNLRSSSSVCQTHAGKRLTIGRLQLRAADGIILGTLVLFSLLAAVFSYTVEGWVFLIAKNLGVGLVILISIYITQSVKHKFFYFLLRTATITLSYAYLFKAVASLQLIIHGRWLDDHVLNLEQYIFGVQPTLWLEKYIAPWLTEWFMFSYVIYVPFYPILCGIIYYKRGELAMEDYFFTLGLTNVLCDIGFILFPVANPMCWTRGLYTVPLNGYLFSYFGELIRSQFHYMGGAIPSPHTAAATIMWVMAYRYHRPTFYIISPIIISLYFSTFYCRYHYVTDTVLGMATAGLALLLAPMLIRIWDNFSDRQAQSKSSFY